MSEEGSITRAFVLLDPTNAWSTYFNPSHDLRMEHVHRDEAFAGTIRFSAPGAAMMRAVDSHGDALPWVEGEVRCKDGGPPLYVRSTDAGYILLNAGLKPDLTYTLRLWSNSRDPELHDHELEFTTDEDIVDLGPVVLPGYTN